ncbi:MAG TPA: T9SS type B sorting domain-containing protein [Flavisolibacter sp.]|nr:T9SS type B sorting domain-containing protein [Flavisolibacter sp.]
MKSIGTLLGILLCLVIPYVSKADHITGGEMYYTYAGFSNGMHNYNFTLKFYMRCYSGRTFNNPAIVSVFDKGNNSRVRDISVTLTNQETIQISNPDPCITNPPTVCYEVGYYNFSVSLPPSAAGYILASQVNFRIAGINNLEFGYAQIGATYTAEIPGTNSISNGSENNSARFVASDLVVVCANNSFAYSFAAEDKDGDQLRYSFCNAYRSGVIAGGNSPTPTVNPPFQQVPYGSAFGGSNPLGSPSINPNTGLITGMAPSEGAYVVTVCVEEIRNGNVIAVQRKDIQINIAPCTVAGAMLDPEYQLCRDTKTISISNQSTSPLINTQDWIITNRSGQVIHTSRAQTLNYTFQDTGLYDLKLIINRNESCSDSTTSLIRVYPGFKPDFTFTGICANKPTTFKDATATPYGTAIAWDWDFGDYNNAIDQVSSTNNPSYTYPSVGERVARLIVGNSNGCIDTVTKLVTIMDKPPLKLAFKDTLICIKDNVQLLAEGNGIFSWTPALNLSNANTANPIASPKQNTFFIATLNDNGCIANDTVFVRVTDKVALQVMADTTICQGDTIQLQCTSDAFTYSWSPAAQLDNASLANPSAVTNATTTYSLTASIGSCLSTGQVTVRTVPYPKVDAGADARICFGTTTQLSAQSDGLTIQWSPETTVSNSAILNPIASPVNTTAYVAMVSDNKGCPKPSYDTVLIDVIEDIAAFAGRDTAVIVGQPLQFNASPGTVHQWSPAIGLSSTSAPNPVGNYETPSDGIRYRLLIYNEEGCVDSAFLTVKVFTTKPSVFVPSAFTPNGDMKNDLLRPIAVGIKSIEAFHVYNRWGQLVFSTTENGKGWDGKINGQVQPTSSYVWMVKATDYMGKSFVEKGITTLIK